LCCLVKTFYRLLKVVGGSPKVVAQVRNCYILLLQHTCCLDNGFQLCIVTGAEKIIDTVMSAVAYNVVLGEECLKLCRRQSPKAPGRRKPVSFHIAVTDITDSFNQSWNVLPDDFTQGVELQSDVFSRLGSRF